MTTTDAYPAARNRVLAITEATKLSPLPVSNVARDDGTNFIRTSPHASPVTWALCKVREGGLNETEAILLVTFAHHAHAALYGGDGYSCTRPSDVADILGWPVEWVERALDDPLPLSKLLWQHCHSDGGWRIPDDALDGNWLDRATRNAHYGAANQH